MQHTSAHTAKLDQVLVISSHSSDKLDNGRLETTAELILSFKLHFTNGFFLISVHTTELLCRSQNFILVKQKNIYVTLCFACLLH
jgi:hypothetical protein